MCKHRPTVRRVGPDTAHNDEKNDDEDAGEGHEAFDRFDGANGIDGSGSQGNVNAALNVDLGGYFFPSAQRSTGDDSDSSEPTLRLGLGNCQPNHPQSPGGHGQVGWHDTEQTAGNSNQTAGSGTFHTNVGTTYTNVGIFI